jgi:DNA-binding NarL/FixJ family response regulator
MRVILVGAPEDRMRLRAEADGPLVIVGEASTLAAVDPSLDADAVLVAHRPAPASALEDVIGREPLTDRETEVLELLAEGLSNKSIGARLGISDQTVKFHVASICGKLGARNRTEAVRLSLRRGLITL